MIRTTSVFALALISGAATAGPLANAVNGLLGIGGPATAGAITPISGPLTSTVLTLETAAMPVTNAAPLPGLAPNKAGIIPIPANTLPVGVNVLEDGSVPGTGYDIVLGLGVLSAPETIIGYGDGAGDPATGAIDLWQDVLLQANSDNEPLGTPYLIGQNPPSGFGAVKVAVFGGDNVGNSAFGTGGADSGIGVAVGSGNNTGNGTIGIGVGNDAVTGNGSAIGIAALSDNRNGNSGNGGQLGVSALNQGDLLTICGGGTCGGADTVTGPAPDFVTPSNEVLTGSLIGPDNSGNGGLIAASAFSGNNTGQGDVAGIAVGSGDDSGRGSVAVGVLTGDNSAQTTDTSTLGGVAAVAVLSNKNSAIGQPGAANPVAAAPVVSAAVLSGGGSGNDANAVVPAQVLTSSGGGTTPVGPPPGVSPGGNPDDNGESAQNNGDSELCGLLAKDNRGRVKGKLREKANCAKLKSPKA